MTNFDSGLESIQLKLPFTSLALKCSLSGLSGLASQLFRELHRWIG